MAIRNPLKREKPENLSPAQQRRRMIVGLSVRAVILFMMGAAILYTIISTVVGSSLFIPKSAEGVLDSVKQPVGYTWTSELTRQYTIQNQKEYYQNQTVSTVNLKSNKIQAMFYDVFPTYIDDTDGSNRRMVSDGQAARTLDSKDVESAQEGPGGDQTTSQWILLNDPCDLDSDTSNDAAPLAKIGTMPLASDIKAANPEIKTDKATWRKERAWLVSFTPTEKIIKQLMLLDLADTASRAGEKYFVLSEAEREALAGTGGSLKPIEGGATITRDSRELTSVYVKFKITTTSGESVYQVLGQIVPLPPGENKKPEDILGELSKDATDCGKVRTAYNQSN